MRVEPFFLWGLVIALLMFLFYIGVFGFMIFCLIRDFVYRNDKERNRGS